MSSIPASSEEAAGFFSKISSYAEKAKDSAHDYFVDENEEIRWGNVAIAAGSTALCFVPIPGLGPAAAALLGGVGGRAAAVVAGTGARTAFTAATSGGVKLAAETGVKAIAETGIKTGAKALAETGAKTVAETGLKAGAKAGTQLIAETGVKTVAEAGAQAATRSTFSGFVKSVVMPNMAFDMVSDKLFGDEKAAAAHKEESSSIFDFTSIIGLFMGLLSLLGLGAGTDEEKGFMDMFSSVTGLTPTEETTKNVAIAREDGNILPFAKAEIPRMLEGRNFSPENAKLAQDFVVETAENAHKAGVSIDMKAATAEITKTNKFGLNLVADNMVIQDNLDISAANADIHLPNHSSPTQVAARSKNLS